MKNPFTTFILFSAIGWYNITLHSNKADAQTPGILWANSIKSANFLNDTLEGITGIAVDAGGNTYICGSFIGTADFDPGPGVANLTAVGFFLDPFFAKYDANGNFLWAKSIASVAGNALDIDACFGIAVDANGNVFINGLYDGTADFNPDTSATANLSSLGKNDIFFAKYDTNGNYLWAKSLGSTDDDRSMGMTLDFQGNIYLIGSFSFTIDFDPGAGTANLISNGNLDIFFAKYDNDGNYIWAKSIGSAPYMDIGNAITVDAAGNTYITGYFQGTNIDFDPGTGVANLTSFGVADIFFAKYDNSGNYLWAKNSGGTGDDRGNSIAVDANGSIYLTGYFNGMAFFDNYSSFLTSGGLKDIFLAKYDAYGNYVWANKIGGTSDVDDQGNSVTIDSDNNIYITGFFQSKANFDPVADSVSLISNGIQDIFFAKYNTQGNYIWAKNIGGANGDYANAIIVDFQGKVYLSGSFNGTVDFNPGAGTTILASTGGYDGFFAKFVQCGADIEICLVTVDSLSQNNIIIWDKPIATGIDSIIVYRDTANNNYAPIGAVSYDSLSQFIDTSRSLYSANGDPNASSWRYKIAVLDTCGNISALSPFHQTLFMINSGGTFMWSHYQIEGQNIPVPGLTNYIFQRDDSSLGNWQPILPLVSASSTFFNDPQFTNFPNASYRVMTQWSTQCTATKSSVDYNSSRSNVKSFAPPGSVKEYSIENAISIYPNPNNGTFELRISNASEFMNSELNIYNILGELIYFENVQNQESEIRISKIPKGIYNLQIENGKINLNKKLVIE